MTCPFLGPDLKIRRAERHYSELDAETRSFLGRRPFRLVVEELLESPWNCPPEWPSLRGFVLRVSEPLPDEFATIIGDVVHNLRSALDILACDLVRLIEGGNANVREVSFPFGANEAVFEANLLKPGGIFRAGQNSIDFVRSQRPFNDGNEILQALHDLDIRDKHRLLLPVLGLAGFDEIYHDTPNSNGRVGMKNATNDLKEGNVVFAFPGDVFVHRDGKSWTPQLGEEHVGSFHLVFGRGDLLRFYLVLPTLLQMISNVRNIVRNARAISR